MSMDDPFGALPAAVRPAFQFVAEEASESLIAFVKFMFMDPDAPLDPFKSTYQVKPHHRMLAYFYEKMESLEHMFQAGSVGPQFGKSTIISEYGTAWLAGRNPDKHVIVATYGTDLARKTGRKVREIINSERYRMVFPDVVFDKSSRSAQAMKISGHGGTLYFPSVNSATTGFPCDFFIIDDPYKDKPAAHSEVKRKAVQDWYNAVASARCKDTTAQFIFHTRWHFGDLQGYLTDPAHPENAKDKARVEDTKKWVHFNVPAIVDDAEIGKMLGIPVGRPIWPERFSLKKLEYDRRRDPANFEALYMGRPSPEAGDLFSLDLFKSIPPSDFPATSNLRIYAGLDLAVTKNQRADYSVLVVWGVSPAGTCYVLDVLRWKLSSDKLVDKIIEALDKYKPIKTYTERGLIDASIGPFLRKRMRELGRFYTIESKRNPADKEQRAQATISLMGSGRLVFPTHAHWLAMTRQEFLQFPNGLHDDIVDAFSEISIRINAMYGGDAAVEEVKEEDLAPKRYTIRELRELRKRKEQEKKGQWRI